MKSGFEASLEKNVKSSRKELTLPMQQTARAEQGLLPPGMAGAPRVSQFPLSLLPHLGHTRLANYCHSSS